jgi:Domain of unknown function (DUF4382)
VHLSSGTYASTTGPRRLARTARLAFTALLSATLVIAAGCKNHNQNSGYGVAWVTLTDTPGDFTTYRVNVDSIVLTRSDSALVTALATVETVDFTKLNNIAELWGTATIPTGVYTQATIVLDYTSAQIGVMVNGVPQLATVVDSTGVAVTTQTINVLLDPANPLTIVPTYATTAAQRLAIDFNLAASTTSINLATSPATVTVKPYLTVGISPPDNKMVRVRGPLINSSVNVGTYSVYVRPFFDEIDSLGALTMFVDANTNYVINGVTSTGTAGITQLSQSSAGTTMTAAYTTYEPTATPSATAGDYHVKYVIAGSTLEDVYTQGLEGDVVARNGNTLTLRGPTIQFNSGVSSYTVTDATVTIGPNTDVTADNDPTLSNLSYASVGVGQHVIVRGVCSAGCENPPTEAIVFDATNASSTSGGSVRLVSTSVWGTLVSTGAGSLVLDLQTINDWPVSSFTFAGNGATAASDTLPASYVVNTGAITVPDTTVGDSLWIDGLVAPFGSAPPDFNAITVNSELSVQTVGAAAGTVSCGQGVTSCMPASLQVKWTSPGTATPFTALTATGMSIDLANASLASAVIRIGAENIDLVALGASPQIVPQAGTGTAGLPAVYTPAFAYGNPTVAVASGSAFVAAPGGVSVFSVFGTFATGLTAALPTAPALQFEARGTYDRASNTFSASSVNVVF